MELNVTKSIIAKVENLSIGRGVYANADVTADNMGNAWLHIYAINNDGNSTRETLTISPDDKDKRGNVVKPNYDTFAAIRSARVEFRNEKTWALEASYSLDHVLKRVMRTKSDTSASMASKLANALTNDLSANIAEAIAAGDMVVKSCLKQKAMRGLFAALAA